MEGKFIVFEGPDGSGKTTQLKLLAQKLVEFGYDVVTTREPGGTKISEDIRNILLDVKNIEMHSKTEAFLYASARAQHVEELIKPALKAGKMVLCDRFTDSTIAYQGYGRNLDKEFLTDINKLATGGLKPDLTIILDLDPLLAKERIRKNREALEDRIEQEKLDFHQRVRQGFLKLAQENPQKYLVIDGTLACEEIAQKVLDEVERI